MYVILDTDPLRVSESYMKLIDALGQNTKLVIQVTRMGNTGCYVSPINKLVFKHSIQILCTASFPGGGSNNTTVRNNVEL